METRVCMSCGTKFVQYENLAPAKRCPTCIDLEQRRDSIAVRRTCLLKLPSLEISIIPGVWEQVKHRREDFPSYKIEIPGKDLPGSTEFATGKIVLRSRFPYKSGAIAKARVMEAVHVDRPSGRAMTRRYIALDDRSVKVENTPILHYLVIGDSETVIEDKSLWSVKAYSNKPSAKCDTIAILAIIDKHHTISLSDSTTQMTLP